MDAREISQLMSENALTIAQHLLPHGQKTGKEWRVGSVDGEKGQSLGVSINGAKQGVWCDFSSGESGDLLELWKAVRGCDFVTALHQAADYLNVSVTSPDLMQPAVKKFTRPQVDLTVPVQAVNEQGKGYFQEKRHITQSTLDAYKIAKVGGEIAFPLMVGDEVFNVKYLKPRKQEGEKNHWRQEGNAEPCLFGWQVVDGNDREIAITEGEIDALSIYEATCGVVKALSMPSGAENLNWIEYDWERLNQFSTIYLCLDNDAVGQKALINLLERLGEHRCMVVSFGDCKDANECLVNHGAQEVAIAIGNSESKNPEELKNAADFADDVWKEFMMAEDGNNGVKLPFPDMDELTFQDGDLTVWTGYNGHGKSQLLGFAACDWVVNHGQRVCIFSGELPPKKLLKRMVRQTIGKSSPTQMEVIDTLDTLGGHLNRSGNLCDLDSQETGGIWIFNVTGNAKLDRMLDVFAYAKKRYNCKHFIVDSLVKLGVAESDLDGQSRIISILCDFKMKLNVHIHLVAHPKKPSNDDDSTPPTKYCLRGSSALTDLADNVLIVWRNKEKEKSEMALPSEADARLICEKQRDSSYEPDTDLYFNKNSGQYTATPNRAVNLITGECWNAHL